MDKVIEDEYVGVTEINLRRAETLSSKALQRYAQSLLTIPQAVATIRNRMAIVVNFSNLFLAPVVDEGKPV